MGREVDGNPDVADPGRERSRSARRDRVDGRQPALPDQPPELEHGRVEPLDVTDLDRHAGCARRGNDLDARFDRGRERLLDEDGDPAFDRGQGERNVGRRRCGDDDGIDLGLGQHRERLGEPLGAGLFRGGREDLGERVGARDELDIRAAGQDPEVIPAHRPETGETHPQHPVPGWAPGGRHRAAAPAWAAAGPSAAVADPGWR